MNKEDFAPEPNLVLPPIIREAGRKVWEATVLLFMSASMIVEKRIPVGKQA